VLVVGGGDVASRRAHDLAHAGAAVEVVTPWASEVMWAMADSHEVRMTLREFSDGDQTGAWLVHTCTGVRDVDDAVAAACEASRVWCVRADDAAASAAWTPAVARHDDLIVAVTANGDPRRSIAVRDAIGALLETGALPRRRHRRTGAGWVALVGGGPGRADLITVRGRQLLDQADVVVVDRLAPRDLLDALPPEIEVIEAGKGPDAHTLSQAQINDLIVTRAVGGCRVVRLKGGDPFVLGRGGEEVAACAAAGVPVEVVPGITSAIAVPGAAGIPVTHRGVSSQFTVLSAHDSIDAVLDRAPDEGTLIVLMGVGRLAAIVEGLVARGRSPREAVAIIERGTTPDQRTTTGTLETIVDRARTRDVRSPAVVVIGEVAALADDLAPALTSVLP
jgi:uroporphyrin-III C-methyltransferase/precorrin-2 dehydrogenase/sirohydrochlorin ferrochelatase